MSDEATPGAVTTETLYELLHDRHRIRRWRIGREAPLRALRRDKTEPKTKLLTMYTSCMTPLSQAHWMLLMPLQPSPATKPRETVAVRVPGL